MVKAINHRLKYYKPNVDSDETDMEALEGLGEFITIVVNNDNVESANTVATSTNPFFWTANNTKLLLDLYKKYKEKVGSMKLRNFKAMWDLISKEISKILGSEISAKNVENRWKVLDRNFKKYIDNKNATGRGRKFFEFAAEMEEIYATRRSVRPDILLGSETQHVPADTETTEQNEEQENVASKSESAEGTRIVRKKVEGQRKKIAKSRKTVLQQIREDRLMYQENRLNFLRQAHEESMALFREKNEIKKQRNKILSEKKCTCHFLDRVGT